MRVTRHAETMLVALGPRLPVPASVIIAQLREAKAPSKTTAIEVCRLQYAFGSSDSGGSNGDSVVVIVRDGEVITAMLRRSWAQQFTPAALRVEEVVSWREQVA